MGNSVLSIGISGLSAAQAGLITTSHNIANASTPGYNKQGIVQSTNNPVFSGVGFFGQGTDHFDQEEDITFSFAQEQMHDITILAGGTKHRLAQLDEVGVGQAF